MSRFTSPLIAWVVAIVSIPLLFLHPTQKVSLDQAWGMIIGDNMDYLVHGAIFLALFTLGLAKLLPRRKLGRRATLDWKQVRHEIVFSLSSNIVMITTGIWLTVSDKALIPTNYQDASLYGGPIYIGFVAFLLFVLHDTAFYWTHRAMHHKVLYGLFHKVHHESVEPTPFATFSFHPLEAIVQNLNSVVPFFALLALPWHESALVIYGLGVLYFNIIGHLGFEIYPKTWHRWPILGWKTTSYHHFMHHQRSGGNYGLYFRFWDRFCGTEFHDYEARQDALFMRAEPNQKTRPLAEQPISPA